MMWGLAGIAAGILIGWFAFAQRGWFVELVSGGTVGAVLIVRHLYRLFLVGGFFVHQASQDPGHPLHAALRDGPDSDAYAALPVWTRFTLGIPEAGFHFLLGLGSASVAAYLALWVHRTFFVVPPPPETRKQLRARLHAEMKYSDDLLG